MQHVTRGMSVTESGACTRPWSSGHHQALWPSCSNLKLVRSHEYGSPARYVRGTCAAAMLVASPASWAAIGRGGYQPTCAQPPGTFPVGVGLGRYQYQGVQQETPRSQQHSDHCSGKIVKPFGIVQRTFLSPPCANQSRLKLRTSDCMLASPDVTEPVQNTPTHPETAMHCCAPCLFSQCMPNSPKLQQSALPGIPWVQACAPSAGCTHCVTPCCL